MRLLLFGGTVLTLLDLIWPDLFGLQIDIPDREDLLRWINAAGLLGPIVVVGFMALAIVASPLPSAPIALAAGAAYGHTFGTLLVVLGAEIGALAAFLLARGLGRPFIERHIDQTIGARLIGSQNMLAFLVFASRLLPFLSFDLISYAAGLSKLHLWRFALATLAGIVPASFLLAHFGSVAMNGDMRTATWTAVVLGAFTGLSVIVTVWRKKRTSLSLLSFPMSRRRHQDGTQR